MIRCFICNKRFDEPQDYPGNCVNPHCNHSNVPNGFVERRDKCVQFTYPIIGSSDAGKSYYLYTLTRNLVDRQADPPLKALLKRLSISLEDIHGYDVARIRNLRKTLGKAPLDPTLMAGDENFIPIVFHCRQGDYKAADLCFFDLAGEHFHDNSTEGASFAGMAERLKAANGLFVFIDPYSYDGLNRLILPQYKEKRRIINRASQLIKVLSKLVRSKTQIQQITTPIAFCLVKFDLLEHNIPNLTRDLYIPLEDLFTDKNKFNKQQIQENSKEVEKFVAANTDIDMDFIAERFLYSQWFAISTIGHPDIVNKPDKIEPRGIYAPFFWLLYQHGRIH